MTSGHYFSTTSGDVPEEHIFVVCTWTINSIQRQHFSNAPISITSDFPALLKKRGLQVRPREDGHPRLPDRDCKVNADRKMFARICRFSKPKDGESSAGTYGRKLGYTLGKGASRPFTATLIRLSRVRIVEIGFCRPTWRSWKRWRRAWESEYRCICTLANMG